MEEKIRRIVEWSKGTPQGPISIHLDTTNRCNQKCRFCWQRSHKRSGLVNIKNELSEKKLLQIVREAAGLGVKEWLISGGGEPLVRTDTTVAVMKEIKKHSMLGDMITNGTIMDDNHIADIVESGWDIIRFSINATTANEHDFLVDLEGAFDKVIANIKKINEMKRESGNNKPEIGFNTVINSKNYSQFPEIIELLHKLGGTLINVQTVILYSEEEKKWTLDDAQQKQLQTFIKSAVKKAEKYKIKNNLESYLEENIVKKSNEMGKMNELVNGEIEKGKDKNNFLGAFCYEPWYLVTIRADGTVGSCRLFGDNGDNIHNKTLKEIWYGEYFKNARKTLLTGGASFCSKCGANEFLENRRIRSELAANLM